MWVTDVYCRDVPWNIPTQEEFAVLFSEIGIAFITIVLIVQLSN
jgi:hypothetical protein